MYRDLKMVALNGLTQLHLDLVPDYLVQAALCGKCMDALQHLLGEFERFYCKQLIPLRYQVLQSTHDMKLILWGD
jgi:hypothetical protein